MSTTTYNRYSFSMASTSADNNIEKAETLIASSEKILKHGFDLICNEGERPDITAEWAVRLPPYNLSSRFGTTYFGRYRWFDHNTYRTANCPQKTLKSTAPAFIEQWEKWSSLKSFLDLLSQWQVEWLVKQVGTPLAALQLVVDVADQLLTREHLLPAERSPIMTVLLTSAESHLKWPAHYLMLMHQERNHPLHELRNHAREMWDQQLIQRAYLQKCATTSYATLTTAKALHTELVRLLSTKIAKSEAKQVQANDVLALPNYATNTKSSLKESFEPSNLPKEPTIKVTLTIRKRTAEDAIKEEMSKPSKSKRHELDRGFRS
jgi:hypothetical protein